MNKKIIITAALAGSATFKHQNKAVPYSAAEFAEEAYKAYKAGAAMVHLHARDEELQGWATAKVEKGPSRPGCLPKDVAQGTIGVL